MTSPCLDHLYVGYTDANGDAAFEPFTAFGDVEGGPYPDAVVIRGLADLLVWCNQERAPDGGLHRLTRTPNGLDVVRPNPRDRGYWIAEPVEPDEDDISTKASRLTRHDGLAPKTREPRSVDTFDELERALGDVSLGVPRG